VVSLGIFSVATDRTMCSGVDSASRNECQDTPGGKDGWCVRVTTLPPMIVPKVIKKSRSLNLLDPQVPAQACSRKTLPLPLHWVCMNIKDCIVDKVHIIHGFKYPEGAWNPNTST
jgi:hypothetical protein